MNHIQHKSATGEDIPSVSQIPGIFHKDMTWFQSWICKGLHSKEERCCAKSANDYYKEAANLGHDIHSLRELFLRGEDYTTGVPKYQGDVFQPIARFYKESGYKPLFIEQKMTGEKFGGTLDGAGMFSVPFWQNERRTFWANDYPDGEEPNDKTIWIDDLKIKSKIDITHPLQLYGYRLLLKECRGVIADWGLIIRREKKLYKRPEIQLKAYYLPFYEQQWDAAMTCYNFLYDKA